MKPHYKIYLDTSIFNHALWSSRQDFKDDSLWLLNKIKGGLFKACTSDEVIREINRASDQKRERLLDLVHQYPIDRITDMSQADAQLSEEYVRRGVIPKRYLADALHIAIASRRGVDVIASLNFEHMVKLKTNRMVNLINAQLGLSPVEIREPEALKREFER